MKMKHLLLSTVLAAMPVVAISAELTTAGNGTTYTLATLAELQDSPVTRNGNVYTMSEGVTIANGDKFVLQGGEMLMMATGVQFNFEGEANLAPETMAVVTRTDDEAVPKGLRFVKEGFTTEIKNVLFDYVGVRNYTENGGGLNVSYCTFRYCNGKAGVAAAIGLGASGACFKVADCNFLYCTCPAIAGGANVDNGIVVERCTFIDNNTDNRNKPQINITVGGDNDVVIRDCVLRGAQRNMVGGIAVGNMLSISGANRVYIENCDIRGHRYGMTGIGPMDMYIRDNVIIDNCYETNPNNGGSGISLNDTSGKLKAAIAGNYIEGNLWGVTVIKCGEVSLGNVEKAVSDPYQAGGNVFKDNGNSDVLYDLYNNSANTVYAQNNTWNVDEQTAEKIEGVIFHKADNAELGEVIYMPAYGTGGGSAAISSIADDQAAGGLTIVGTKLYVDSEADAVAEVYAVTGQRVATLVVRGGIADLGGLTAGSSYIIRVRAQNGSLLGAAKYIL